MRSIGASAPAGDPKETPPLLDMEEAAVVVVAALVAPSIRLEQVRVVRSSVVGVMELK